MNKSLLIIFFTCALISVNSHSQILRETFANLDLNPGGVVHDVVYDDYSNTYIVVGDFTSIGGFPRINMAFIDANTFTVTSDNLITSIDGAIYTIAKYNDSIALEFPGGSGNIIGQTRSFYIGGVFGNINGQTKTATAKFVSNHLYTNPPATFAPFQLNAWQGAIMPTPDVYISDIISKGDTIVMVGSFYLDNNIPEFANDLIANIIAYNPTLSGYGRIPLFTTFAENLTPGNSIKDIEIIGNQFLLAGDGTYSKFDENGVFLSDFETFPSPPMSDLGSRMIEPIITGGDTLLFGLRTVNAQKGYSQNFLGSTSYLVPNGNINPINLLIFQNTANIYTQEPSLRSYKLAYKQYIFSIGNSYLTTYELNGIDQVSESNIILFNSNSTTIFEPYLTLNAWENKRAEIAGNNIFVSGKYMNSASGSPKAGLAVFCIEPEDPKEFTSFDTTICEGNLRTYTIPKIAHADGYRWSYTGSGASFRIPGAGTFEPLTDTIIENFSTFNFNSIETSFGVGSTGGVLTVTPFSLCNTSTDYQFANGLSINLIAAPLPNISLLEDTMSFTCVRDSFYLVSQSTTPNTTFEWEYNLTPLNTNDSIFVNLVSGVFDSTYFYAYVYEPVNECRSTDSVFVVYDTLAAQIDTADFILTPPYFGCSTDSLTVDLIIPNATIEWDLNANASPPSMSNYTIYNSNDSLLFYAYATYASNGCRAQQQYAIPTDIATLPGGLTGYPNYGSVAIDDTLNCFSPTLSIESIIGSGTGTAEWITGGLPSGSILNLAEADTVGMNSFGVNVYQFVTTNTDNGCTDTLNATIMFDFELPFVADYNDVSSLNCSATSLNLTHQLASGNVTEGWLDGTNAQTFNDTLSINAAGSYYYQVQSTINGCVNTDTVVITQTNELLLDLVEDTLICLGQVANIVATPINNTETTTYTWSTGASTQDVNVMGGVDFQTTVVAQTVSGCIAYDTVNVLTPSPVIANFIVSSGCFDGNIQVGNVTGGTGNYQYSLDQVSWETTTAFTGLNFGTHTIFIQDDLGCIYSFNETIDGNAGSLDVNFLVSTYNENGDTLAIVNVSNFTGFDSLVWTLPPNADTYSIDDSMVILSILSGGWYDVTLTGYQDTCGFNFTKPVYFGDEAPVFEGGYDTLGIVSLTIYPNPTAGSFIIDLEYAETQNYSIIVTNMQGQPLPSMSVSGIGKIISESFTFPVGSSPGSYGVHIISDFDATQKTIILN